MSAHTDIIKQSETSQRNRLWALRHLPSQLRTRQRLDELTSLLINFEFIHEKCKAWMAYDLAQDYTATLDAFPERRRKTEQYESLESLGHAIRLSAHVLNDHPSELPSQLSGRLIGTHFASVGNLLRDMMPSFMWLRPLTRALVQAGGPLRAYISIDGGIQQFIISPDCTRAIAVDQDHRLIVWDLDAALPLHTISPQPGHDWLAIAPAGNYAFTYNSIQSLQQLWDLQTGQTIGESINRSSQIVFSADGKLYVTYAYEPARNSGILSAHETRSGAVLSELGSKSQFSSPPRKIVLSDSGCSAIMVWASGFAMVWHLFALTDTHYAIAFSPGAGPIVICRSGCHVVGYTQQASPKHNILKWLDTRTGEVNESAVAAGRLLGATQETALLSSTDRFSPAVSVFDLTRYVERFSLIHDSEVKYASAVGDFVLTATVEGTLALWNIATGRKVLTLCSAVGPIRSRGVPSALHLGTSTNRAASLDNEGITVWRSDQHNPQDLAGHHAAVTALVAAATGAGLASAGADWTMKFWSVDHGVEMASFKVPRAISSLTIAEDGGWVAAFCGDGLFRVWDMASRRIVATMYLATLDASAVGIFRDTSEILIRTNGQLELANWQRRSRRPVAALPVGCQHTVSFTKDGPVFYWYYGGTVFCWRRGFGVIELLSVNSTAEPIDIAASAECDKIALRWGGEERKGIELWDVQTGSLSWRVARPPGNILSLSPSGLYTLTSTGGSFVEVFRTGRATSSATFHAEAELTKGLFAGRDDMLCLGDSRGGIHFLHINEPASRAV